MNTVKIVDLTGNNTYEVQGLSKMLQYMSMNKVGVNEFLFDPIGQTEAAVKALRALCKGDIGIVLTQSNEMISGGLYKEDGSKKNLDELLEAADITLN